MGVLGRKNGCTIWECATYDHLRDNYALRATLCMRRAFGTAHQRQLARFIAGMDVYRWHLLGRGNLFGVQTAA